MAPARSLFSLDGRTALITGGSRGLGLQIAEAIGHPAEEVVYWVMGMRRYGHLVELPDDDDEGWFPYALTNPGA